MDIITDLRRVVKTINHGRKVKPEVFNDRLKCGGRSLKVCSWQRKDYERAEQMLNELGYSVEHKSYEYKPWYKSKPEIIRRIWVTY